jgi:hypothetical protein
VELKTGLDQGSLDERVIKNEEVNLTASARIVENVDRMAHVDSTHRRMHRWSTIKKTILPGLINSVELKELAGVVSFTVVESLENHYMVYYTKARKGGWVLLTGGDVPFKEFQKSIHEQALKNLSALQKAPMMTLNHNLQGDHAIISFDQIETHGVPMRTAILDPRLMKALLLVNFNVSLSSHKYFFAWEPFAEKLIVSQKPHKLPEVARENKLNISSLSPILSVAIPSFALSNGHPFQAMYADVSPGITKAH